jgi:uncharacterized protein
MPEFKSQPPKYPHYRHRCVQDLAWCVFSPPLIVDARDHEVYQPEFCVKNQERLLRIDEEPQQLMDWLSKAKSTRLGFVFERLWQYWWLTSSAGDEWLFNQQVNREGRTLGELDALQWQPITRELRHYELAVKFYLGVEKMREQDLSDERLSWVGPNCIDRLDIKWPQMSHQQLTALTDEARTPPLPWLDIYRVTTRSLTRGRLFHPLSGVSPLGEGSAINPTHDSGQWLRLGDWPLLSGPCWRLLQRNEWLAPVHGSSHRSLLTHTEAQRQLLLHFEHYRQPIQIIRVAASGTDWVESGRFFVVPNDWPPAIKASRLLD